jgi:hypothetical protein
VALLSQCSLERALEPLAGPRSAPITRRARLAAPFDVCQANAVSTDSVSA